MYKKNKKRNFICNINSFVVSEVGTKLWCNCGTVPQLHPTVGFSLFQVDLTHLSGSNGWCNCGTVPQLHCSLTPEVDNKDCLNTFIRGLYYLVCWDNINAKVLKRVVKK